MANEDPQKQLLTLIRDFAAEKSQGERRVTALKKCFIELQPQLDAANAELENAKRSRESTEQGLKGSELELALNEASIRAQQARIASLQGEISTIRSELDDIRSKERVSRDGFINQMLEFNKDIRKFQELIFHLQSPHNEKYVESSCQGAHGNFLKVNQNIKGEQSLLNLQTIIKDSEENLHCFKDQINVKVQEYEDVLNTHKEVLKELSNLEPRVFLLETVVEETKQLQFLARQTAEMEQAYGSLGEELQRRFTCPICKLGNTGELRGLLLNEGVQ